MVLIRCNLERLFFKIVSLEELCELVVARVRHILEETFCCVDISV